MKLRPYTKMLVAAFCAGVVTAGAVFDNPYITVAAAIASPIAVYFARNEVSGLDVDEEIREYAQ